ncbi:MAG: protein phosphatase 2C domain-containing protein [Gallintestinimicrobium sp.]
MKAYAITDIGKKRSFNQDYAWMTTDEIGKLPNLFIVADGMGGHRGGGYASRLAVETILEQIRQSQADSPAEILWMRSVMQTSVSGRRQRRMNS